MAAARAGVVARVEAETEAAAAAALVAVETAARREAVGNIQALVPEAVVVVARVAAPVVAVKAAAVKVAVVKVVVMAAVEMAEGMVEPSVVQLVVPLVSHLDTSTSHLPASAPPQGYPCLDLRPSTSSMPRPHTQRPGGRMRAPALGSSRLCTLVCWDRTES